MDPRISTVESDVAAMRANVETIHSNYATNIALLEVEGRLRLEMANSQSELHVQMRALHGELGQKCTNIALVEAEARLRLEIVSAKNELNLQLLALDQKIDRVAAEQKLEFQKIAGDMRNWLIATVIGLFVGFGGLFIGLARILKP